MIRWHYLLLFVAGLMLVWAISIYQHAPGYMDADYYFATGKSLATGQRFNDSFLWNYLDDPEGLPHPSHAYWMPLASFVSAAGMLLMAELSFPAAKIGFLLIAGFVPVMTAILSSSLTGKRDLSLFSGLLAAIPAFYLSFLATTDTFGIYMLLGGAFFISVRMYTNGVLTASGNDRWQFLSLLIGLLSGLMHLARSDGFFWLFLGLAFVMGVFGLGDGASRLQHKFSALAICLLGYLLVMAPWLGRNWIVFGTPFSPGGLKTLWLTEYDHFFSYPADLVNPSNWWESGVDIIKVRLSALGQNLQTSLAVQGEIFLAPMIAMGMWKMWPNPVIKTGFWAWLVTLLIMSLVFPFPGTRGGFFHSGSALQPLFWAVTPVGLQVFVDWGVRSRGWIAQQAGSFFKYGLLGLALLTTIWIVPRRVIGRDLDQPKWNESSRHYSLLEDWLQAQGVESNVRLLVNNPPGYYATTSRPAVVIPDGGIEPLLAVAARYGAQYVLLEFNHPKDLDELYRQPGDVQGLDYLITIGNTHVFRVVEGRGHGIFSGRGSH